MSRLRRGLVWVHRIGGLLMAGFLVVAGLTGAALAWYHEADTALNPTLRRVPVPHPGAAMLDPLELRERVQARYPEALAYFVLLDTQPGEAAMFFLRPVADPATGRMPVLEANQVFMDPYTGEWLGDRHWGAFGEGWRHLMPIIYRIHSDLALGEFGHHLFGIVALAWTLDCVIGAWLTLPAFRRRAAVAGGPSWWQRWRPAWSVRWRAGSFKLHFDLHRAAGLWPWALLFVFAWSSVAFNLGEVYYPVMKALLPSQETSASAPPAEGAKGPPMPWPQARETGRAHMAALARERGFTVLREHRLSFDPRRGQYNYRVQSDRDIRDRRVTTMVTFDAASGALVSHYIPTGEAAGDTATTWFLTLHLADIGGWPYKLATTLLGGVIVLLSVTGVYVWWRKRRGRQSQGGASGPRA